MSIEKSYNEWAAQYDTNENKTRDLEAKAVRELLKDFHFINALEIGCGTGKNTQWLVTKCDQLTSADLSEEMLRVAKEKVKEPNVSFIQFDMLQEWNFANAPFDLISFSLVLEHIENISIVIQKAAAHLMPGGRLYIGELHPFKQYSGSQAKFETESGIHHVECYMHHLSDFINPALHSGVILEKCVEWFDEDGNTIPRILSMLFRKS